MAFAWTSWAICMHWLACLWMLLPQLQGTWREDPEVAAAVEWQMESNSTTLNGVPIGAACTACYCGSDAASARGALPGGARALIAQPRNRDPSP